MTRWTTRASQLGWSAAGRRRPGRRPGCVREPGPTIAMSSIGCRRRGRRGRADVVRTICDLAPAQAMEPVRWAAVIERAADRVLETCVDLDPSDAKVRRRVSDGRSVWIEPTAARYTSSTILAQEEQILTWAMERQSDEPEPSCTVDVGGLDVMQAAAARAAAGWGSARAHRRTRRDGQDDDAARRGRARVPAGDSCSGWHRPREQAASSKPRQGCRPTHSPSSSTNTPGPTERRSTATSSGPARRSWSTRRAWWGPPPCTSSPFSPISTVWRVVLVGDPRQLQAVGRGGLFAEICGTGRVHELITVHRFTDEWEAAASLRLRHGDPTVFDTYHIRGRITPAVSTPTSISSPTTGSPITRRDVRWRSRQRRTSTSTPSTTPSSASAPSPGTSLDAMWQ